MSDTDGRINRMSRRRVLGLLGTVGAVILVGCEGGGESETDSGAEDNANTTCILTPTVTEGPYFVDENLNRSDLTTGTAEPSVVNGLPLQLNINVNVYDANTAACTALSGVQIDVWHASATGLYSDVSAQQQGTDTTGETFLRGYQITDENGDVSFTTIYPGWYQGRTVHIHLKARLFDASGNETLEATTQAFFDDPITDTVFANAPYSSRGTRDTRNADDDIYDNMTSLLLTLSAPSDGSPGYVGSFSLGISV